MMLADLVDIAIGRLGNAELAAAVRGLDDESLARLARESPELRRMVLAQAVRAHGGEVPSVEPDIDDEDEEAPALAEAATWTARKADLAPMPPPIDVAPLGAPAPAPEEKRSTASGRENRQRVLAALRTFGARGASGPDVAEIAGLKAGTTLMYLGEHRRNGLVRSEGVRNRMRWFSAEVEAPPPATAIHLPIVDADKLTEPGQRFRCVPYNATLSGAACLARQANPNGRRDNLCADCDLGRTVAKSLRRAS